MLYTGGEKFIPLPAVRYAASTILFVMARRERGKPVFTHAEWLLFGVIVAAAIGAAYRLASGNISI